MPYIIRKVKNKQCYEVKNKITGELLAKCTTKPKAEAQVRLLHMKDYKKK